MQNAHKKNTEKNGKTEVVCLETATWGLLRNQRAKNGDLWGTLGEHMGTHGNVSRNTNNK